MVQIQIDVDEIISKELDIYTAINSLAAKTLAVEEILKNYFKQNPMPKVK